MLAAVGVGVGGEQDPVIAALLRVAVVAHPAAQDAFDRVELLLGARLASRSSRKMLGGLPFSGNAAWKVASRAALTVPSAESPSQMNSSAPTAAAAFPAGQQLGRQGQVGAQALGLGRRPGAFLGALGAAAGPGGLQRQLRPQLTPVGVGGVGRPHGDRAGHLRGHRQVQRPRRHRGLGLGVPRHIRCAGVDGQRGDRREVLRLRAVLALGQAEIAHAAGTFGQRLGQSLHRRGQMRSAAGRCARCCRTRPRWPARRGRPPPTSASGSVPGRWCRNRSPRPQASSGAGVPAAAHIRSSSASVPHGPSNGSSSSGRHLVAAASPRRSPQVHPGHIRAAACARSSTSLMSMTQSGATVGSNRIRTEVPWASGLRLPRRAASGCRRG